MPHEVIMPALGMAQSEGVILRWLKDVGDPVAPGEALMEVETDKAAVEIEAEAGGTLAERRAEEGAAVPVGQVVAVIAAEGESVEAGGAPAPAPAPAQAGAPGLPEGTDVILPALGMAQATGTILRWLKAPGEKVAEGEPLFEVETDKAAVEVPAEAGGWLAAVLAGEGAEVPVGDRVAVITAEAVEVPIGPDDAPAPAAPEAASAAAPEAAARAPDVAPGGDGVGEYFRQEESRGQVHGGRILASPKARRLAAGEGLDLARLRAAGVAEPYHVADLETLRAMPAEGPAPGAGAGAARDRLTARVPGAGLAAFLDWAAQEGAGDRGRVLAAFAAGALRRAAPAGGPLLIAIESGGETVLRADPDRDGATAAEGAPALILRDLGGTHLTSVSLGADAAPVLTLAGAETIELTLEAAAGTLARTALIDFLDGMAARLDEPLRHLL